MADRENNRYRGQNKQQNGYNNVQCQRIYPHLIQKIYRRCFHIKHFKFRNIHCLFISSIYIPPVPTKGIRLLRTKINSITNLNANKKILCTPVLFLSIIKSALGPPKSINATSIKSQYQKSPLRTQFFYKKYTMSGGLEKQKNKYNHTYETTTTMRKIIRFLNEK